MKSLRLLIPVIAAALTLIAPAPSQSQQPIPAAFPTPVLKSVLKKAEAADPTPEPPAPVIAPVASIVGPTKVCIGKYCLFDGSSARGGTIQWRILPTAQFLIGEGGTKISVEANPPFDVIQIVSNGTTSDVAAIQVTLADPPPTPTPTPTPPGPTPVPTPVPPVPPTPTPVASSLWIVTLDDAAVRTQQTAQVIDDLDFWQAISKAGHHWANVDANNPAAAQYQSQITQAGGMPCVLLMDATSHKVLGTAKLTTKDNLTALIKTLTGK